MWHITRALSGQIGYLGQPVQDGEVALVAVLPGVDEPLGHVDGADRQMVEHLTAYAPHGDFVLVVADHVARQSSYRVVSVKLIHPPRSQRAFWGRGLAIFWPILQNSKPKLEVPFRW